MGIFVKIAKDSIIHAQENLKLEELYFKPNSGPYKARN
jgi:hypothetical protein